MKLVYDRGREGGTMGVILGAKVYLFNQGDGREGDNKCTL